MSFRVSIDTGGTFTDAVAVDEKGNLAQAKALTDPRHLPKGVMACLDELARTLNIGRKEFLGDIISGL